MFLPLHTKWRPITFSNADDNPDWNGDKSIAAAFIPVECLASHPIPLACCHGSQDPHHACNIMCRHLQLEEVGPALCHQQGLPYWWACKVDDIFERAWCTSGFCRQGGAWYIMELSKRCHAAFVIGIAMLSVVIVTVDSDFDHHMQFWMLCMHPSLAQEVNMLRHA